jgi:hypothetical protein
MFTLQTSFKPLLLGGGGGGYSKEENSQDNYVQEFGLCTYIQIECMHDLVIGMDPLVLLRNAS